MDFEKIVKFVSRETKTSGKTGKQYVIANFVAEDGSVMGCVIKCPDKLNVKMGQDVKFKFRVDTKYGSVSIVDIL